MRFSRRDWPQARREALVFLAVAAIGTLAVAASHHLYQKAGRTLAAARVHVQNSRDALAAAERERTELAASLGSYRELADRAVFGEEQRLQWRMALEAGQRGTGMDKVSYSLSPRQPWSSEEAGGAAGGGIFRPYRSAMTLRVEFLRETAFLDFLEDISGKVHAIPVVRSCEIARLAEPGQGEAGRLAAECLIDWATLRRAAPAGETFRP